MTSRHSVAVFASLVLFAVVPRSGHAQDKLPVPKDSQQQKVRKIVSDLYKDDFENLKSRQEKATLANSMITAASETVEPVDRYVLLDVAMQLSVGAHDVPTALDAIGKLQQFYYVDAVKLKVNALTEIAKSATKAADCKELAGLATDLADVAVADDRFEIANNLLDVSFRLARKAKDNSLARDIKSRREEIKALERKFTSVKGALATLEDNPTDAKSNQVAGSYLCFVKGDWQRGLPMLALSEDRGYRDVARRELAEPKRPAEQAELADLWWSRAENSSGTEKARQQLRAQFWYEQAAEKLTGLAKLKVQKRLDAIAKLDIKQPATTKQTVSSAGRSSARPLPAKGNLAAQLTQVGQLLGHDKFVREARFSADGKVIKSSANDGKTIIWNAETGKILRTFQDGVDGFSDSSNSAMSPDGKLLAVTQTREGILSLWDIQTGEKVRAIKPPNSPISRPRFSPTGEKLGAGVENNVVLWETTKWEVAGTIERTDRLHHWSFSPDGKLAAIMTGQNIEIWDVATGQKRSDLPIAMPWTNISISPDNRLFVAAPRSHNILIYNLEDGRQLLTLNDQMGTVRSTMFHPGGRILASGDAYKKIFLWDAYNGRKLFEIQDPDTNQPSSVHFSSDGKRLVSGHTEGQVKIWKVQIKLLR